MPGWFTRWFNPGTKSAGRAGSTGRSRQITGNRSAPVIAQEVSTEFPAPLPGIGNLDHSAGQAVPESEEDILHAIGERLDHGSFEVPHLPSTTITVLDLTANPLAEVSAMVEAVPA